MSYNPIGIIIKMVVVVGVLLMIAFDKFPKDNGYVTQDQFLIGLAVIAFLYFFAELSRGPRRDNFEQNKDLVNEQKNPELRVLTLHDALTDASNTGVNVHYIRIFDGEPGYSPVSLNIGVGDVVVWTNVGEVQHTVTSAKRTEWMLNHRMVPALNFDSKQLLPGESFAIKFLETGWFPYYDVPNEGWMHGEININ